MGSGYFAAQNKDTQTIRRGQVVAIHSSGSGVILANASDDTKNGVGLMSEDTIVGATQNVVTDEIFSLSDWTNVVGATQLDGGEVYFLDVVSGKLTSTSPAVIGQVSQRIGRAISHSALEIECEEAVLL